MSKLFEGIKNRRSIRKYKDQLPPKSKIEKVIEGANWAPSDGNSQPWKFYVTKGKVVEEMKKFVMNFTVMRKNIFRMPPIFQKKKSSQC